MLFSENSQKLALYDTAYEAVRELIDQSNDLTLLPTLEHIRQQRREFYKSIKPHRYVIPNPPLIPGLPNSGGPPGAHPKDGGDN